MKAKNNFYNNILKFLFIHFNFIILNLIFLGSNDTSIRIWDT